MSSASPPSSESDARQAGTADERKRKRMESNRESARRSRQRKQQHLEELVKKAAELGEENQRIAARIQTVGRRYCDVEKENAALRAHVMDLTERLRGLNAVLEVFQEVAGPAAMNIPYQMLEPWQVPVAAPPMIVADVFNY